MLLKIKNSCDPTLFNGRESKLRGVKAGKQSTSMQSGESAQEASCILTLKRITTI